jgi:hypothetical protein
MSHWRIYYDDGTTSDDVGLRTTGVIGVAEPDPDHNWTYWIGKDWYILQSDGQWMGCDLQGMIDQVTHRLDRLSAVCQGRIMVPYSGYAEIVTRMQADCKPPKTAWHGGEKP